MARVIVILTLMLMISALIFAVTRKPAGPVQGGAAGTTVPLSQAKGPDGGGEKEAASAQDVAAGVVGGAAPTFGTVGVDHKGWLSFTGTASPGDEIMLTVDDATVGRATARDDGSWAVRFKVRVRKDPVEVHLQARGKDGTVTDGPQRALVRPAETNGGLIRVALVAADLSGPQFPTPDGGEEPSVGLIVEKISVQDGSVAKLVGRGDPGASVKALVGGAEVGEATVGSAGEWEIRFRIASAPASDSINLRLIKPDGTSLDETRVPFRFADANGSGSAVAGSAVAGQVAAVEPRLSKVRSIRVRKGDSLWRLAQRHLGDGRKWRRLYRINRQRIADPNLIYPGQRLRLPA